MCYTGAMTVFDRAVLGGRILGKAADLAVKLGYYEWAYGHLAEPDSDIGILGEFMAGLYIGGLDARRREKAPYDLVADDGTTVEVKTSFGNERAPSGGRRILRWQLKNERAALRGERPVARTWLFLHVTFTEKAGRIFDVFAPEHWQVYVVPGDAVRRLNQGSNLSSTTLETAGYAPHPITDLPRLVCPARKETSKTKRENTNKALLLLRIEFFRWAYGDLTEGFNGGRFAEYQVLRLIGVRPFPPRRTKGPVDLVSRHGHAVEVKYSQAFTRTASGLWRCNFIIPVHHGKRAVDHFAFCQLAEPGLDPLPLANWRFRWVPAEVLEGYSRKVANTALDARGYKPMTALEFALAEARGNPGA